MTRTEELEPVHREEDGELVGYLTAERRDGADVWNVCHSLRSTPMTTLS